MRWCIATFFRASKQDTSFEDSARHNEKPCFRMYAVLKSTMLMKTYFKKKC